MVVTNLSLFLVQDISSNDNNDTKCGINEAEIGASAVIPAFSGDLDAQSLFFCVLNN